VQHHRASLAVIGDWKFDNAPACFHEAAPMPEGPFPIDEPIAPLRVCDKCNANMTHLSDLPDFHDHAAARSFRCYACNNVALQEWSEA
jgi:hypothetical protein